MPTMLGDILDVDLLNRHVASHLVKPTTHPHLPLTIYNYTPEVQFEKKWDDVTCKCRGLIVKLGGEVVARPFEKFFNYGEMDAFPSGDPVVEEKVDGSLGIIYPDGEGGYAVATRGSFGSDQAIWATDYLHATFPDFEQPEGVTTLVEIVYPENRIVVDYHGATTLVLLGAIDIEHGYDVPVTWWEGDKATCYQHMDLNFAQSFATSAAFKDVEGVVLVWKQPFAPSVRVKVKHPRYVELHRLVTGLSTRSIWEALSTDTSIVLADIPDEFHPWIRKAVLDLAEKFCDIEDEANANVEAVLRKFGPDGQRKDQAAYIMKWHRNPGLVFALLDGKSITGKIWKMIKPERETAMILDPESE